MAYKYNVKGVGLDQIFDPYISGTKAALTGYKVSGVDLRDIFAPLYLGTTAPITNYKVKGADLNTFFAAKGTASYALPINGQTFTESTNITSGNTGYAEIGFKIVGGTTWQVYGYNSITITTTVLASGSVPSGATNVQYTFGTPTVPVGQASSGGSTTNGAATSTAISLNPQAKYTTATVSSTSGSRALNYPFTIDFFNSGAANISHTSINLVGDTEGSV